ncbi:MAG: hypothetical protein ACOH2H_19290 [Cypionkella sp.]
MDRNLFALSLGLAGMILLPALSRAEPARCAQDTVAASRSSQFGEMARSIGPQDTTATEIYSSP